MFNNRLNRRFVFGLQLSARTACLEGDKNKAVRAWGTVMNFRWLFCDITEGRFQEQIHTISEKWSKKK